MAPTDAGVRDATVDVGHLERDVADAVTVRRQPLDQRAVRLDRPVEHEPGRTAVEHVRVVVAQPGRRAGVGDELHAVDQLVVRRGLRGVADRPDQRVPTGDRERVVAGVVVDEPDELA